MSFGRAIAEECGRQVLRVIAGVALVAVVVGGAMGALVSWWLS